jgi:hypothetical protein
MPTLQQAAEAMKRAREVVASRIRRNIVIHNPRMSSEAIETLVEDELSRVLAAEVEESEPDFAIPEWADDEVMSRPRATRQPFNREGTA